MRRFFAFLVVFLFALPVHAQNVTDIRIGRAAPNHTRFVLDISQSVPYRAFVLNNPMRLVIDLPNIQWSAPMNKGDAARTIKSYRKGVYNQDTLRIVVELNKPMILTKPSRLPPEKNRAWRYVFDLKPVDPMTFNRSVNVVHTGGGAPVTATKGTNDSRLGTQPLQIPAPKNSVLAPPKTTQVATNVFRRKIIVLDAGHGGFDPGARAVTGVYEKVITLATAREVKKLLEATGKYTVKMTRDSDVFIKLPDRVKIARRHNADLFVSLHADTIGRSNVQGASVYTLSDMASDLETAKLAERENAVDSLVNVDVGQVDADVEDILIDLVTRDTMNQSKILAETVVDMFHLNGVMTLPQRPHRAAGFAVLKAPDIPSVLIEMGYLSNREEAKRLSTPAHRLKVAKAVVQTIDRYFTQTSKQASY